MISILYKTTFLLVLLSFSSMVVAQPPIKSSKKIVYSLSPTDSIVRYETQTTYDTLGRLLNKTSYHYNRASRKLTKEEKSTFDPTSNILSESITTYRGSDVTQKKLKTKYLVYAKIPRENKRITRLLYDNLGDIVKEDTISYNEQQNPTEKCTYDYRGNTSLVCEAYDYDKQHQQCRWRTYSKWTTIDAKGEVAEKQKKRRDYKFRYNKNGDLKRAWGKYYTTKMCRKLKYTSTGLLIEDKTVTKRTIKRLIENKDKTKEEIESPTKKAKKKYKKYKQKDVHLIKYQSGKMIEELKTRDKQIIERTTISYQDSVIKKKEKYLRKNLSMTEVYEYNENLILLKKTQNQYTSKGVLRLSVISFYDIHKKLLKEEQWMNGKLYSTLNFSYDQHGNLKEKSLSSLNSPNFEKTTYIYKYF